MICVVVVVHTGGIRMLVLFVFPTINSMLIAQTFMELHWLYRFEIAVYDSRSLSQPWEI